MANANKSLSLLAAVYFQPHNYIYNKNIKDSEDETPSETQDSGTSEHH